MSSRKDLKQIWVDKDFVKKLEEIKAKRLLAGMPVRSMGELTKEIANTGVLDKIEKDMMNLDKLIGFKINIKCDKKLRELL